MNDYGKVYDNLVDEKIERRNEFYSTLLFIATLIVVLVAVVTVKTKLITVIQVSGPSMETTLSTDDLLIAKTSGKIKRGDIIVFYSERLEKTLIKRVIALPGETVFTKDGYVYIIHPDSTVEMLEEDYLTIRGGSIPPTYVNDGYVYVLGDNRTNSTDSRTLGAIEVSSVTGIILDSSVRLKNSFVTYFYRYL